jgi:hypothetical protein
MVNKVSEEFEVEGLIRQTIVALRLNFALLLN